MKIVYTDGVISNATPLVNTFRENITEIREFHIPEAVFSNAP